jgi:hypothetical protein
MLSYEKLGAFYLGRPYDLAAGRPGDGLVLYDSKDLVTHAVCVGMTGSGKTGLGIGLLEEAAIDGIPSLVIDPKGDMGNLLLTFPELEAEQFRPWINEDDARRKNLTPDEHAAAQADLWRNGLAAWGQDGERIRRLRAAAEFAIYTPGSEAGEPISIVASFAAPPAALIADGDLYRERIATTVTSLLSLLGVDADPIRSREHILLSTLLDHQWKQGRDADLGGLIQTIQSPPVQRVGVLELDSFYPAKERFELAMRLNNLLAAPGFQVWMKGQPLDVGALLHTPAGKPRVAIVSIAHLSEAERIFFVSLLLNETVGWMRSRPGTTSLRAVLYMDEIFGFMPPVAEPPSKKPLLTLLKQARAYGLGVVLATQNPVDLDYKGLSNTGTWFLGRLQTERDKARVMDGLEGVGGGLERRELEKILSGLGKRVFLLHNVHDKGPVVFETRWVMSYLRGPLTRRQIGDLMAGRRQEAPPAPPPAAAVDETRTPPPPAAPPAAARPVLDPGVPQVFLPLRDDPAGMVYRPALLGLARVSYVDRKSRETLRTDEKALLLPLDEAMIDVDWQEAEETALQEADLERQAEDGPTWGELPAVAAKPKSYGGWEKELATMLYRSCSLDLLKSATYGLVSEPGESEREFRVRLGEEARQRRDEEIAELRSKNRGKVERLEERIRKAKQTVEVQAEQVSQQRMRTAISLGSTLLAAFTGRSFRDSAGSALGSLGRTSKERQDVRRAQESVAALTEELEQLGAELEAEIEELEERFDPAAEELTTQSVRPRKSDIEVRLVALTWCPWRAGLEPAWR